MDSRPDTLSHADLLEHAEFLHRLARRLVRDEHRAEDLVQDAQLAALAGGPRDRNALRAWFAGVMRHLSSNARRSQVRSVARERAAARAEAVVPADELRARLETQRVLATHVGELDEAYARVIFLRFYEGLPPRVIAARLGVPVATVKTRLQRALERLRARLDAASGGDRRVWCVALSPLSRGAKNGAADGIPALAGVAMHSKLALTLTSVVIAFGVWRVTSRAPDAPGRTGSAPSEVVALADLAVVEPVGAASELVDLGPPAPTERQWFAPKLEPQTVPPSGDWNFTGTVTSIDGVALSGAAVVLRTEPRESARATCDAEGRYRLSIDVPADVSRFAPIGMMLTAEAPGFRREERILSAVRASDEREDPRRIDFALVPSQHVLGVARDPSGEPLLELPVALVDQAGAVRAGTRTDARGAFALELADAEEFWVAAGSVEAGYAVAGAFVAPASGDLDVGAILVEARGHLAGIVSFPDDSPVANTRIVARRVGDPDGPALPDDTWLAGDATVPVPGFRRKLGSSHGFAQTDANGGFTFSGLLPGEYELELPYLGDFREAPTAGPFLTGEFANVVVLAYSVHVRVVDQVGRAVPGARLWIQRGDTATIAESRGLEGSWDFGATPGPWVVTASLGGAAPAEHVFEVVEGTYETWIELELDFEPTTGRLQVLVEDEHGTPLDGFTVTLWRADETVMVADYTGLVPDAAGVLPPIPVGAYAVRAVFTSFADDGEPTGAHFSAKGSATIGVARLSTVRLATTSGGRMQLRIDDASGDLPPERVEVRVTLGDGLGVRPTTVHNLFRPVDDGLEIDVPRLGAAGYTDLLRSGAYTLRAEADGYRILEQSVVILAGETTPIGLLLERE